MVPVANDDFLYYLLNLDIPADIINNSVHARV
jgi:hypothetical protein